MIIDRTGRGTIRTIERGFRSESFNVIGTMNGTQWLASHHFADACALFDSIHTQEAFDATSIPVAGFFEAESAVLISMG